MPDCAPSPKASVWARHAARYTAQDGDDPPLREVVQPGQDKLSELPPPKIPAAARCAAAKRAYRAKMKPLSSDDWERIGAQAEVSARMQHESAGRAAIHAQTALAEQGYTYPYAPILFRVKQALNPRLTTRNIRAELRQYRNPPIKRLPASTPILPEVITVELVAETLTALAFPGGDVGVEGRFNWLSEYQSRVKSVFNQACKALPGADLTEFGVTHGPYGIGLHFVLNGETHRRSMELFNTRDRTRGKTYKKREEDV